MDLVFCDYTTIVLQNECNERPKHKAYSLLQEVKDGGKCQDALVCQERRNRGC